MGKLFLFGIGGTGSRVIKSLSFLLASGVKLKHCSQVVPIIVDPHQANKDLQRTIEILKKYEKIRSILGEKQEAGFFNTQISTLGSLKSDNSLNGSFTFELEGVKASKFKHFIGYDELSENNKTLVDLLFSRENLETNMDEGFYGNPHIGSIVLNQFKYSNEFKTFANNFDDGDRVFIISSIFGGTGASGFPIILKNIRSADNNPNIAAKDFLKNAPIGALTVMPYFNVEHNSDSQIQKSEWVQKTKSALSYYERNVTGNRSVNAMYYIGDTISKTYANDPGQFGQQNDAHFIEMVGALSIIDFANTPKELLECEGGYAVTPFAKEFGIKEDAQEVNLTHLGTDSESLIAKNLIQLGLSYKYLKELNGKSTGQPYEINAEPKLDASFYSGVFYKDLLLPFLKDFADWLNEMKGNKRAFNPINLTNDFGESVNGLSAKSGLFVKKLNSSRFITTLNEVAGNKGFKTPESKMMDLLFEGTTSIIEKYYDRF